MRRLKAFVDNFFTHLFSDEISQLSTRFSKKSDFSKGFLKGRFISAISFPETPNSDFWGDFQFYIDSAQGGPLEYGLNFQLRSQIQGLDSFLAVISDKLTFCLSETSPQKFLNSFCETKRNYQWDPEQSTLGNLYPLLQVWKSLFYRTTGTNTRPRFTRLSTRVCRLDKPTHCDH